MKRIASLILAVWMVLAILPFSALAEDSVFHNPVILSDSEGSPSDSVIRSEQSESEELTPDSVIRSEQSDSEELTPDSVIQNEEPTESKVLAPDSVAPSEQSESRDLLPENETVLPPVAENMATSGDWEYSVYSDEATITKYTGSGGSVRIPSTLGGYPVVSIEYKAFYNCKGLTSITIPDSVTTIGGSAFSGCTGLTSITIPDSVTTIGGYAFDGCKGLTSVTIPDSVTSIGSSAFSYCSSLQSITLPFVGNSRKTENDTYQYPFGYIFGISLYTGGTETKQYYYGSTTSSTTYNTYCIPSSLKTVVLTDCEYIPYGAFYNCTSLTSVTIPASVITIGKNAFSGCTRLTYNSYDNAKYLGNTTNPYLALIQASDTTITSCVIHSDTKVVCDSAFNGSTGLSSITVPDGVVSIGKEAFKNCTSLKIINIPTSVIKVGKSAIENTAWLNNHPDGLIYLGRIAHVVKGACSATVTIKDGTVSVSESCFSGKELTGVNIPDSVTAIGNYAFSSCKGLTSISIPDSVTSIGEYAFQYCSNLTNITIGNSVTSIGERAFYNCTGLKSIIIPDSVTSIGEYAFQYCSNLTSITIPFVGQSRKTASDTDQYPFGCIFGTDSYTGGIATTQYYYGSSISSTTNTTYYIPSSLKTVVLTDCEYIPYGAFSYCTGLTSVTIPDNVSIIGTEAFRGCTNLTEVAIGIGVTSIGNYAFYGCKGLTSITIPDSVTTIGNGAFSGCTGLTSVTIGNGVTTIGISAFSGCTGLTSVTIPDSVTTIGSYAFDGCTGLTSVTIGDGVTTIGGSAFSGCTNLTSITIPDSVTSIGDYAFYNCTGLTYITIPDSVTTIGYSVFSGCSGLTSITLPFVGQSRKTASDTDQYPFGYIFGMSPYTGGTATTQDYYGSSIRYTTSSTYYIPSFLKTVVLTNCEYIPCGAFSNCSGLTSITIPDSVTSIGGHAFSDCAGLTSITIPDSVTTIGNGAFSGCTGLTSVTIGDGVTTIGEWAFSSCTNLTSVTIPDSVTSIGYKAFFCCSGLTSITIPDSVTTIDSFAFSGCTGLTSVTIGNGVTTISYEAFAGCTGLTSVTIGNGVTTIGNGAFSGCTGLTRVNISDLAAWCRISFGNNNANPLYCAHHLYLNGTEITDIVIPDGVTSIGNDAFYGCTGLRSVTIPDSVTSIGNDAFYGCTGLTRVNISDLAAWCGISFGNYNANPLYCVHHLYLNGTEITDLVIPDGVTTIGEWAFSSCTNLTSITIPDSVTSIGYSVFSGCSGLTSITLPFVGQSRKTASDTYQYPFGYIFGTSSYTGGKATTQDYHGSSTSSTTNTTYYIPSSLKTVILTDCTYIPYGAFYNCKGLTSITIPDGVTTIGGYAFYNCTCLKSITIPDGVTTIRYEAFAGCMGLTKVNISDLAAWCRISFGDYNANPLYCAHHLYLNGTEITDIVIPDGVTSIGNDAFYGCTGLRSVTIPDGVTSIGNGAFSGCTGLTRVNISDLAAWCGISFGSIDANPLCYAHHLYLNGTEITDLVIPDGVTSIGNYAFCGCTGLTTVTVPNSVTTIGYSVFSGCSGLTSITLPFVGVSRKTASGKYQYPFGYIFGDSSYAGGTATNQTYYGSSTTSTTYYIPTSLKTVVLTDCEYIPYGAFSECTDLTFISIPDNVSSIGEKAFLNCKGLTTFFISDSVTTINSNAFNGCAIKKLIISDGSRTVSPTMIICNSTLEEILIPASVNCISEKAFSDCNKLTSIVIPNSVTSIGDRAFYNCSGLTSVTIPNSVTSIGKGALEGCTGLTHLSIPFIGGDENDTVNTHFGYIFGASRSSENKNKVPSALKYVTVNRGLLIKESAFEGCDKIEVIEISGNVRAIDNYGFYGCSDLKEMFLHYGITSIGDGAYYFCYNLTSITISDSVTEIGNYAFYGCDGLTTVYFDGTEEQWNAITIGTGNEALQNAQIVFNAHRWSEWTYEWSEDNGICTAHRTCRINPNHTEEESGAVTSEVTREESCTESELTTFTARFENGTLPDQSKTLETKPALGHDWGETSYEWSEDLKFCTATHVCTRDPAHQETETAEATALTLPASCTADGKEYLEASFDNPLFETQTKDIRTIPALGHDLIHHDAQSASCTEIGWAAYDTCSRCDYTTYSEIAALGHDLIHHDAKAATCTGIGWEAYDTCSRCDYNTYKEIAAMGHNYGEATYTWSADHKTCTAARTCAVCQETESETVSSYTKILKEATEEEEGVRAYYAYFNTPGFEAQSAETAFAFSPVLWGDANGDGKVDNKDIVRLKNYVANFDEETGISTNGVTVYVLFPGADANGDGVVNNKDIVRMKNYVANYDEETGISTNGVTTYVLGPA